MDAKEVLARLYRVEATKIALSKGSLYSGFKVRRTSTKDGASICFYVDPALSVHIQDEAHKVFSEFLGEISREIEARLHNYLDKELSCAQVELEAATKDYLKEAIPTQK